MTDYANELLADFGSQSDSESEGTAARPENVLEQSFDAGVKDDSGVRNGSDRRDADCDLLDDVLARLLSSTSYLLHSYESTEDIRSLSRVLGISPLLKERISKYSDDAESAYWDLLSSLSRDTQSEEYKFIIALNEVSQSINEEISMFHNKLKAVYKPVFGELETIIIHPVDYARTVLVVKQDLAAIKTHDAELKSIMSHEKVLVIIMAALQQLSRHPSQLGRKEWSRVLETCTIMLELDDLLRVMTQFITLKLAKFAPNVTAIVGPVTASQLIIATGSLKQLAHTPSCNIAAYGTKENFSQKGTISRQVRQNGYLFHSDMVKFLPVDIVRSSMRIISGKVVLAARIDLSKSHEDGLLGKQYAQEIQVKIDKLLAPPDLAASKALPLPVDIKSKKRGGRRIRKMKERFQMSELRKAQNKMEFGKKEETVFDAFGEEVGMGMSRGHAGLGRIGQARVNANTKAKMSKGMASRLEKLRQGTGAVDDLDAYLLQLSVDSGQAKTTEARHSTESKNLSMAWLDEMETKRPQNRASGNEFKRQKH